MDDDGRCVAGVGSRWLDQGVLQAGISFPVI